MLLIEKSVYPVLLCDKTILHLQLCQIWQNTGFLWLVFSPAKTESLILPLHRKVKSYSFTFNTVSLLNKLIEKVTLVYHQKNEKFNLKIPIYITRYQWSFLPCWSWNFFVSVLIRSFKECQAYIYDLVKYLHGAFWEKYLTALTKFTKKLNSRPPDQFLNTPLDIPLRSIYQNTCFFWHVFLYKDSI